ncbi:hypothetical protein TSAR_006812 [Trichomalopsis sarcophagae]|uniref:Uncharacterized protein n=1 Tax=Trichomalopsis sarcophagae TaxID=543379 RepID=A0A232F349_9HYME|nr:hypothetical protein TSAR_006812 [Trichomalopsis sarcophagae]
MWLPPKIAKNGFLTVNRILGVLQKKVRWKSCISLKNTAFFYRHQIMKMLITRAYSLKSISYS